MKSVVLGIALLIGLGCQVPQPTPQQQAANEAARKKDQSELEGAIRDLGIVYVATCSEPYTVTYADEHGVQRSVEFNGRFWYGFTPKEKGQFLKIDAHRSYANNWKGEIWVQMYANGKLYQEDHKVGSEAFSAVVVATW